MNVISNRRYDLVSILCTVVFDGSWFASCCRWLVRETRLRQRTTRVAAGTGHPAVARKLTVLGWHVLTHGENYAVARSSLVRRKTRALELKAGAARGKRGPSREPILEERDRRRTRAADRRAGRSRLSTTHGRLAGQRTGRRGAGATSERASDRPSKATPRRSPQAQNTGASR